MRKLFKGGNYSRAETIHGNTVLTILSVLISENEKSIQMADCKDKISSKKCKKLKKKGKYEDKKISKKCMETCQKCPPGTIAIDNFQLFDSNSKQTILLVEKFLKF